MSHLRLRMVRQRQLMQALWSIAAGLYACDVSNMLLPKERHIKPYYAKGNYFTYTASKPKPKRLIYPCPEKNFAGYFNRHSFGSKVDWEHI